MKKITFVSASLVSTLMPLALAFPVYAQNMQMTASMSSGFGIGTRSTAVVDLQTFLSEKGYLTISTGISKGYFGPMTKRALMKYQHAMSISATGYFGPRTMAATKNDGMMMSSDSSNTMSNTSSNTEAGVMVGGALMIASRDIVDNAVLAPNVTTVVAAVKAAGLVDTLKSSGPFTVFAPNNAAFAKLPAGTVETLIKPENKATLTDILTYHVVAGRYTSADITDGMMLKTVEGKNLTFKKNGSGKITINGTSMVETPDVISRNGVTFVIDTVLMPQ